MSAPAVTSTVDLLPPIGLGELVERAGLLLRVDRKYVVPVAQVEALVGQVAPGAQVLEIAGGRQFLYDSVYFDTPDLLAYRLAAHRRRRRFKIRTRRYVDSAECWLEVKTRGRRGETVKNRLPYALHDHGDVRPGHAFVADVLGAEHVLRPSDLALAPVLATRYVRTTLFLPASASRVTIDTSLSWQGAGPTPLHMPGYAIVETKTGSAASEADRLLWSRGHRPTSISKYATGLAALRPELPSNRWQRTLRSHFEGAPTRVPRGSAGGPGAG
ncbi:polyphosphate polymerase domain-containing protein [Cellulomonas cellasea]|uniref:VTC domain-containing protein n=1 Tax=Cellulomonas cellasea TaxID=43670 RepID=A0A7W4YCA1_9CELL|nr:polyphosphate polymerase domain-containing protein [Cellulomonas cellasea]MBB2923351.1 hypothetical protein [Cellulomonas cellasea]